MATRQEVDEWEQKYGQAIPNEVDIVSEDGRVLGTTKYGENTAKALINGEAIEKPSYSENDEKAAFLQGVGKHGEGLVSLLNIAGVIIEKEKE